MTVEIKIYGETAGEALRELHEFSGGIRQSTMPVTGGARAPDAFEHTAGVQTGSVGQAEDVTTDAQPAGVAVGKRERGKPSPGRSRRTREEIAEDEAADAVDAISAVVASEREQAQISSGENRNGPEDDAETEAQDRADEQAETEANRNGLTLDDLRMAIGGYQKRYGMAAVTADVPTLLGKKMMEVSDDELPEAIQAMKDATENNPLGREPVAKPSEAKKEPEAPPATKADVVAALMAYALKYDGQNTDQNNMPNTMADGPKVLQLIFGEGVVSAGKIPASPENYAKAVAGINEMIAKDPYKRGAK